METAVAQTCLFANQRYQDLNGQRRHISGQVRNYELLLNKQTYYALESYKTQTYIFAFLLFDVSLFRIQLFTSYKTYKQFFIIRNLLCYHQQYETKHLPRQRTHYRF